MMRPINIDLMSVNPVFARHETFHPRFGWLKKGYDLAVKNPEVFLQEDAPVRLGVGKNMVRAIRYWCAAFKVLEDDYPSDFGAKLLGDDGWDPYLEDPASLWLLHWNLLKPPCNAATWYFTFYLFRQIEFSPEDLFNALSDYRESNANRIADSSLHKDVSCLLRMYSDQRGKTGLSEDSLDCPFTELGIIQTVGNLRRYTFRVGPKVNLPSEVVVAACLEFADWVGEQKTISISRLIFDLGSPGLAFKLSESAVCNAIEQVQWLDSIRLSDSAGLIQFSFTKDPLQLASDILNRYYEKSSLEARR